MKRYNVRELIDTLTIAHGHIPYSGWSQKVRALCVIAIERQWPHDGPACKALRFALVNANVRDTDMIEA